MKGGVDVHNKSIVSNNEGFSLVEVVLALTILALVTLPIINYFTYSSVKTIDGRERQTATMAAEDVMDELNSYSDVEQIANLVATATPSAGASGANDTYRVRVFYKYSYTVPTNVSAVDQSTIKNNLKRVVCLEIKEGIASLVGMPTSTPTAVPSATPDNPEKWSLDPSPLPTYTPDSQPLDIMRKVVVNNGQYTAKVHFDFDTYGNDTKTVTGADIATKYNDYYVPSPREVYGDTNVVTSEDDEIDTAVSAIYTDLKSASKTGVGFVPGQMIQKEVTLEQTEVRKDKLKNIFIFYKPTWDSGKCDYFKVICDSHFTEEAMKKINVFLTCQDQSMDEPGATPNPAATPLPGVIDNIGMYTLVMDDSQMANAIHANYYSNLNRKEDETVATSGFTLAKNDANKWNAYVAKNKKRRIAKIYVDIFAVNETEFTGDNVLAHVESSYAE